MPGQLEIEICQRGQIEVGRPSSDEVEGPT